MIIDLERYQAAMPYPEVHNVKPDKQLADKLLEGYSGESSELTTVLQYAYHSLKLQKRYNLVSEVVRGIFYVETLHMNFLGDCISKLGGDAKYMLALREKSIYWQASLVNYESTPSQMIMANIQGEKLAVSFYEETAAITKQPAIANLLLRLAEDEKLHLHIFTEIYQRNFK